MSVYSFNLQKRAGKIGETLFFEAHKDDLIREDGRKKDFSVISTGQGIELKTDSYHINETKNFFFERYSNAEKGTPGGPWQALENGTEWFCYMFIPALTCYKFSTKELVEKLETLIVNLAPTEIKNEKHTTLGYRVPRDWVGQLSSPYKLAVFAKAGF